MKINIGAVAGFSLSIDDESRLLQAFESRGLVIICLPYSSLHGFDSLVVILGPDGYDRASSNDSEVICCDATCET